MKKIFGFSLTLAMAALLAFNFSSCIKDTCSNDTSYTKWTPIYRTEGELRTPPQYEAARDLKNPGKIYFYQNYVLVNEQKEGIHIIDNTNPSSPQNIGFIKIDGNVDMAVKGDVLYADSWMDLLTINISNIRAPRLSNRTQNAFQNIFQNDPARGWLVDYKQEPVTERIDCNDPRWGGGGWFMEKDVIFLSSSFDNSNARVSSVANVAGAARPAGTGGSFARFTITGNYLYTVDRQNLTSYNISTLENPTRSAQTQVGWNIETIFPYTDKLFIGSTTGMFIYGISNPNTPNLISTFQHARGCDPVYVEGNRAYVTLHSGDNCGNNLNQLDVIDITTLTAPSLIKTYRFKRPMGLSVVDKTLYLCDEGVKTFDVTDDNRIDQNMLSQITGFETYDIIAYDKGAQRIIMVIGADGLHQFDMTTPTAPRELSRIQVKK